MIFIGKFTSFKNKCIKRALTCYGLIPVILLLLSTSLHAATIADGSGTPAGTLRYNDTVSVFTENILFPKGCAIVSRDFTGNDTRIDSIFSFLSKTDTKNLLSVKIIGSYSPEGKYTFNTNLADARARALAAFVQKINHGINPAVSIKHPLKRPETDYHKLRYAELQITYRNNTDTDNTVIAGAECRKGKGMTEGSTAVSTPPPCAP